MKCPKCGKSISVFKLKEEFSCPKCGTLLRCINFPKLWLTGLAVCAVLTFILDFFQFSFFIIALYNAVIVLVVVYIFLRKATCTAVRESADTEFHEKNI